MNYYKRKYTIIPLAWAIGKWWMSSHYLVVQSLVVLFQSVYFPPSDEQERMLLLQSQCAVCDRPVYRITHCSTFYEITYLYFGFEEDMKRIWCREEWGCDMYCCQILLVDISLYHCLLIITLLKRSYFFKIFS